MVAENLHLQFLPRSLLLNTRNDNTIQSNPCPDDYKKKRRSDLNPQPVKEKQNQKIQKKKKRRRNDKESCEVSAELEGVIAEFLRRSGLDNTLSIFLSETQTEASVKAHKLKLEDIYHYYCHQICKSPIKENMEEGKVNRENSFGKQDVDLHLSRLNIKRKDKGKSRKNNDACTANIFIKTSNGSSEVKMCASGEDLHRNDKSKSFGTEAVDYFSGPAKKKRIEKVKRNEDSVIETYKDNAENSFASNEVENVLNHADPLYKSEKPKGEKMKNKVSSDEMKLTDNDDDLKKSKKKQRRNEDLVHDPINLENNEVFKKEKMKKKKLDEISGELGFINEKQTMIISKQLPTGSNTAKKESNIEIEENPSEYLCKCLNSEQLKEESFSEMTLGGNNVQNNEKRNKKEHKALEKLQPTFMHSTNGGAKGFEKKISEDFDTTQIIIQAYRTFRYSIGESVTVKKGSADNISHSRSTPVKMDGAKDNQSKSCIVDFVDPRLGDNSYWAKDGMENGYGANAQVLGQVRGKDLRHEKTKKKRGRYSGGIIDL